jgi:hypothetical protein
MVAKDIETRSGFRSDRKGAKHAKKKRSAFSDQPSNRRKLIADS